MMQPKDAKALSKDTLEGEMGGERLQLSFEDYVIDDSLRAMRINLLSPFSDDSSIQKRNAIDDDLLTALQCEV